MGGTGLLRQRRSVRDRGAVRNSDLGVDYELRLTVLTWADGEQGAKALQITAHTDGLGEEGSEELTLTLTDPSGGAIVARRLARRCRSST